jgi:hypothetical protein
MRSFVSGDGLLGLSHDAMARRKCPSRRARTESVVDGTVGMAWIEVKMDGGLSVGSAG